MDADHRELVARALGRIPSGLFVVTGRRDDGEETSFLASWVMQAGFDPPTLSVAVGKGRPALPFVEARGSRFAVSVIGQGERRKLGPFYKPVGPGPNALDAFEVDRTPGGLAVVKDCLAWLECRTTASAASGDHLVILGEVVAGGGLGEGEPTVHTRKSGFDY